MEAPRAERSALPRELIEFLIELSIALHRHSMYPSGHPSLEPAVESVVRSAEKLLDSRASVAIGISRRQLLVDDVATDPERPVLRRLAESLHRHHIGALSITRGVRPLELGDALRRLARDPEVDGAVGLNTEVVATWPHLKLHPLSFDSLALGDDDDGFRPGRTHTDLWAGLARAALSLGDADEHGTPHDPSAIARRINQQTPDTAHDQAITHYLLEIAHELATSTAENAADLHRQTMELIGALDRETLRRLVAMGGNREQRHQFVRDAAHGMAADAVLEIVQATATAEQQTISHGLLRMLTKLASHSHRGSEAGRPRADIEFRDQVSRLIEDWTLENPNPTVYGRVLERLATTTGASSRREPMAEPPSALRILQMSLESNTVAPMVDRAMNEVIKTGQVNDVIELLTSPPAASAAIAESMLARLTSPEAVTVLLAQERVDLGGLDALLPRLSLDSFGALLDAIGSSPSRAVRRRLLDWLAQTDVDINALVIARLDDPRWYVQRNMLVLLQRAKHLPEGFSPARWLRHKDARVRTEAIRLQLAMPHEKVQGIHAALDDSDSRVVRIGLAAIPQDCPPDLLERVINWAVAPESSQEIRLIAVTTLARFHEQAVLSALLQLADGGRTFFGRLKLSPKTPVLIAVIRALAETWTNDPRAAHVLAAAARSSDPEIRHAAAASP
jgi:hypothetical protein